SLAGIGRILYRITTKRTEMYQYNSQEATMPALQNTQTITAKHRTNGVAAVLRALRAWAKRHHGRQSLARLDDHMLRDIGLDRSEARQECAKPFWRD
ncbi:MAG: DUF1127 domain-containing protein, partial [Paracoccaceae bacterium]